MTDGDRAAAGVVRLDNRAEVESWVKTPGRQLTDLTDLELVLRLVAQTGTKRIRDVLGDFAFVVWHGATRSAVAAADALGVKKLFYAERNGLFAFASRAEALALEDRYEPQRFAELVALCPPTPGLTAYAGVRRLVAGTLATIEQGDLTPRAYWRPEECEMVSFTPALEREAPAALRGLLLDAVRQRVSSNGDTWAQLSGGLDSSSIVSVSQWLAGRGAVAHGLGGTVTYVDWQNTDADEREYSDAVAARWRVRNETIVDPPLWMDGETEPPHLDEPLHSLAFYPRERRLCEIVLNSGGRGLLAGFGSDELFTGTTIFFADWLARGRLWPAVRDITRWAARGRTSFWDLAYHNAVLPLVPRALRRPTSFHDGRLLPWVSEAADRRYGLQSRTHSVTGNAGRLGRKYRDSMLQRVRAITTKLDAGMIGDVLDVRYPFLARPVVEFALRLPPQLCARPHARKWVLREAMREILPEVVRTRVGKGGPTDALVRSLIAQRAALEPLVQTPLLADLGVVDAPRLRAAFEAAPLSADGDRNLCINVQNTLMTEAWLRIRSGRWPPG
ncbi:MAG: asparagine synthetase B family protein, partial [Gemmatimonadaceae bacterium]